jgi:hypothetical protein
MRRDDIFQSRYVRATDIETAIPVTIKGARVEKVGRELEDKLVVYFAGWQKGMVCNLTNYNNIASICGSDDTDDWKGHEIILMTEMVTFQGRSAPGIRVRAPAVKTGAQTAPAATAALPAAPPPSGPNWGRDALNDEIPF